MFVVSCQLFVVKDVNKWTTIHEHYPIPDLDLYGEQCPSVVTFEPHIELRLAGTVKRLNVEHRTSNVQY